MTHDIFVRNPCSVLVTGALMDACRSMGVSLPSILVVGSVLPPIILGAGTTTPMTDSVGSLIDVYVFKYPPMIIGGAVSPQIITYVDMTPLITEKVTKSPPPTVVGA